MVAHRRMPPPGIAVLNCIACQSLCTDLSSGLSDSVCLTCLFEDDDLLKIGGKRVGPSEFESLAMEISGVNSAVAVGVPDEIKGETVVILITIDKTSVHQEGEAEKKVLLRIESALGKAFRPSRVVIVDELPLTLSSKIHRRVLRSWILDIPPGDISNLANPGAQSGIVRAMGLK